MGIFIFLMLVANSISYMALRGTGFRQRGTSTELKTSKDPKTTQSSNPGDSSNSQSKLSDIDERFENFEDTKSRRNKVKSVNTLFLITLLYVVCILPRSILMIANYPISSIWSAVWGNTFLANTSLNSIVYILRTKKIRKFYCDFARKLCARL